MCIFISRREATSKDYPFLNLERGHNFKILSNFFKAIIFSLIQDPLQPPSRPPSVFFKSLINPLQLLSISLNTLFNLLQDPFQPVSRPSSTFLMPSSISFKTLFYFQDPLQPPSSPSSISLKTLFNLPQHPFQRSQDLPQSP